MQRANSIARKPLNCMRMGQVPGGATYPSRANLGLKLDQKQQQIIKRNSGRPKRMVKIHPEGHIESKNFDKLYNTTLEKLRNNKELQPENKVFIERFVYNARMGKTILKGQKKKIGLKRIVKYLQDLKKLDRYFKKPLDQVSSQDMERFILDLEEGRLKSNRGTAFDLETQVAIKKIIKKFYKWLLGNNKIYPEQVEWIDTSFELPEYKAISKEQVETILIRMTSNNSENLLRNRALFMVLFDSGMRADELLNVRLKHLALENDNYKVRVEFSKTKKRTLSLPHSKKYLDEWLDIHPAREEPLAQLFPMAYNKLRMQVERLGRTINIKGLTPHSLRHSSATYWAKHLSQYQLCYRMGWSMNSKQPARYIDREGLDQEKTIEVVKTSNVEKLAVENAELNKRLALLEEQMGRFLAEDKEELTRIIEAIKTKAQS